MALIHNANNEVGVWTWYEGQAGATGFTIYAELRVAFTPSDAPTSSSGGSTAVAASFPSQEFAYEVFDRIIDFTIADSGTDQFSQVSGISSIDLDDNKYGVYWNVGEISLGDNANNLQARVSSNKVLFTPSQILAFSPLTASNYRSNSIWGNQVDILSLIHI